MAGSLDEFCSPQTWSSPGIGSLAFIETEHRFKIEANVRVVSSQGSSAAKAILRESLRALTSQCPFLITSDVQIDIEWRVPSQHRYESDGTADVDNIIKPILDAISGPDGIMVNDCQLQAVQSYWLDSHPRHSVAVSVDTFDGSLYAKRDLVFFEVMSRLFFPMDDSLPPDFIERSLTHIEAMVAARRTAEAAEMSYEAANSLMPFQRLFHRTRVSEFRRLTIKEYRDLLAARPRFGV